jgi:uncharacterized protein YbjT (DUF2867 family)
MNDESESSPVSRRVRSRTEIRALVAGSTGLVGSAVTELLARDPRVAVTALVRKKRGRDGVAELEFDYESREAYEALGRESYDLLFLCLGTTRKKAGSDDAFRRVDLDYPLDLVRALHGKNAPSAPGLRAIGIVSSIGAESGRGLYLGTKLALEKAVIDTGVRHVIVRPSFLEGAREEFRLGERVGLATVAPLLKGLGAIATGMKRYAPIRAEVVARALVRTMVEGTSSAVLEGKSLFDAGAVEG